MAPLRRQSSSLKSDSEDEAPESLTLASTKSSYDSQRSSLLALDAAKKQKKKDRNRERDKRLKERAASRVEGVVRRQQEVEPEGDEDEDEDEDEGEEEAENDNGIEARMLRAMQHAEDEGESDEEKEEDEVDSDEEMEVDEDSAEDDGDEELNSDVEEHSQSDSDMEPPKANLNHLPEHIFASAFFSSSPKATKFNKMSIATSKSSQPSQKQKARRKKRPGNTPKDIVIGSRTFRPRNDRAQQTVAPRATEAMRPSAKINKFLDKSLSLRGNRSKKRGWERRAANLGSMRRQGPAANFVRDS
ncbi:hypothetical protein GYMLUDRAFT_249186 [Collybiopsis luxurians FD-317 M1]|uniref:Uncharacterized protein n=1 Tax=Collybiopsis luxurians FD-317 M1 TaxID=944289 RepID=A0A0D0AW86_9AGAR|nr:hypothetical protein GYMLUDRAFT_249186 [Collybiopsis luxurians FD-317 M1]